jgi:hypothetical protein
MFGHSSVVDRLAATQGGLTSKELVVLAFVEADHSFLEMFLRGLPVNNVSQEPCSPYRVLFAVLSQSLQANIRTMPQLRPLHLPCLPSFVRNITMKQNMNASFHILSNMSYCTICMGYGLDECIY